MPAPWMGRIVCHSELASMPSTVAARIVGPAQGMRLSTPMASTLMRSIVSGRMCIFL